MSVDPHLVAKAKARPEVAPSPASAPTRVGIAVESDPLVQPGASPRQIEPDVIVLNTRGYNYGPGPAAIDAAAMQIESK